MHDIILPTFGLAVHTALMIYVIIGLTIFFILMSGRLKLVPGKTQSIMELIMVAFVGLAEETLGEKGMKYLPFVLTLAVFIFIANLIGMVPGLLPPTANLNTTVGLALVVFVATHIIGFKTHGIKYYKHFVGPIWWLTPLMIPIELIGHIA
ncbi:MAG: FoF1 ATP synthase subunit a, partial [Thermodesulfobacteriota bacterium]